MRVLGPFKVSDYEKYYDTDSGTILESKMVTVKASTRIVDRRVNYVFITRTRRSATAPVRRPGWRRLPSSCPYATVNGSDAGDARKARRCPIGSLSCARAQTRSFSTNVRIARSQKRRSAHSLHRSDNYITNQSQTDQEEF